MTTMGWQDMHFCFLFVLSCFVLAEMYMSLLKHEVLNPELVSFQFRLGLIIIWDNYTPLP